MSRLVGRAWLSLAATVLAVGLLAPTAAASPIGDAEAAMMAAWEKAGGETSTLGARKGDVYPVADGFGLDFDGGKMFYTTDTGAKYLYGPVLAKYEALGGPADSDLGFPTINEVPGLAGPDSRVSTFSASDNPVIFWTPDHGAFVVRGAMNAAWDKLGSSGACWVPRSPMKPTTATSCPRSSPAAKSPGTRRPKISPPTRRYWLIS
ncbi:LGFP repeat family protein [Mycobacterium kansasii]|uniref:LGFP repeat family protein n=1 Tax=Mycobacterium kansasii TaxID=1768 RepID=A0A1V3XRU9_MYCKA|nr:LGFP repeat family protein [Mycobacterium kansasii]